MATLTTERSSVGGPRVLKYAGVDCVAGETLADIETEGYDYAVLYGVIATSSTPGGEGRIDAQAVYGSDAGAYLSVVDATNGDLQSYAGSVTQTFPSAVLGAVIDRLPATLRLTHDGGNTGTLTIDLYVELHRNAR